MKIISKIKNLLKSKKDEISFLKNIPKINFTEILTNPKNILVILSSNMMNFLNSLDALALLLHKHQNVTLLVHKKEHLFFLERCLKNLKFDFYLFDEEELPEEILNNKFDTIIILSQKVDDNISRYLHKNDLSVKAALDDFAQPELINYKTRTEKSQCLKEKYFSQICGILGEDFDSKQFQMDFNISDSKLKSSQKILNYLDVSKAGEWIFLDISTGLNSTIFSDKQLAEIIRFVREKISGTLFLIDWNQERYDKLKLKGVIPKPFFVSEQDISLLTAHLANAKILISPNTELYHIAQLLKTRTAGALLPDEKKYFFESDKDLEFEVENFKSLQIDEFIEQVTEFLKE
ncbi:MAG: hypothetical protein ISS38_02675 [Candidatus Cloacimonetes bacterium]|nr:hypothetical protein [Candidatus Cloacimonadota bacterium]